jgi:NADH dehydrogenase
MNKVVVVGAGFAGVSFALNLRKLLSKKTAEITLIDKNPYQLFTPNLYEVAASEEEFISFKQIKSTITIPLSDLVEKRGISFLQGEVVRIDAKNQTVFLGNRHLSYDYLVLALGCRSDFFGIPGADKFSLPLKTLTDALRIRNAVEFAVQSQQHDTVKPFISILVAGGGYTGVELAGELSRLRKIMSWKYNYPEHKIKIEVLEAQNQLVAGFDSRLSRDAYQRLKELEVNVRLLSSIAEVDSRFVRLVSGEAVHYDVLAWTTGVRANQLSIDGGQELDQKGRLIIDGFLRLKNQQRIFAIGDECCMLDENGKPLSGSAQDAVHQAEYLAKVFPDLLNNRSPQAYTCLRHGFVVTIGGKWAILSHPKFYLTGYPAYLAAKFAHLRYYLKIMGFFQAVRLLVREWEMFGRND